MIICPKTSFATQKDAQEHLMRIFFEKSRGGRCPNQEYLCPHCNTWHLTSKGNKSHVYKLKINELELKIKDLEKTKRAQNLDQEYKDELVRRNNKLKNKIENEVNTVAKRDKQIEKLFIQIREHKERFEILRSREHIINSFFNLLSSQKDLDVLEGIKKFTEGKINKLKNG